VDAIVSLSKADLGKTYFDKTLDEVLDKAIVIYGADMGEADCRISNLVIGTLRLIADWQRKSLLVSIIGKH
jgi:hypothetical protein